MTVCDLGYEIGLENDIDDNFQENIRRYKDGKAYGKTVEELQNFFDSLGRNLPKALKDTQDPNFSSNVEWFLSGIHNGLVAKLKNK